MVPSRLLYCRELQRSSIAGDRALSSIPQCGVLRVRVEERQHNLVRGTSMHNTEWTIPMRDSVKSTVRGNVRKGVGLVSYTLSCGVTDQA